MFARRMLDNVFRMGAVDWDRRLFDSLIPLPDGTSYNAYLIRGEQKTVLVDTSDPSTTQTLMTQLANVEKVDYIIAHHAEQDHSGSIPQVLQKYPAAHVLCTAKCKTMLVDHLCIPGDRAVAVSDGETLSLGGKTLEFLHTPWVHWPETMVTYLREDGILFSCDFFGSHLATSDLYVTDNGRVYECAKRYYAEIMMPFRSTIRNHLERLAKYDIRMIAPSHGPVYDKPAFILDAYRDWTSEQPANEVVIPYVSMHGSTARMVECLVGELANRGVRVCQFNLADTDIGKLAIALVDAATLVVGTPTVHIGPHPAVHFAAHLANCLRPKLKFAGIVGSYGWSSKAVEHVSALIPNLKVEVLGTVLCKGYPRSVDFEALVALAGKIAEEHRGLGLK
jgi:flavorubredoxin